MPGPRHDPPALGRRLGRARPSPDRRGHRVCFRSSPLLFLPIVFGMHHLYEWTHADVVAHDEILLRQAAVPEHPLLPGARGDLLPRVEWRSSYFLNAWSLEQDRTGDPRLSRRMQQLSGGGLVALRSDDDVCVVRLADVARAALVLDHLRRAHHGRPGADGDGVSHRRPRLAEPAPAARCASSTASHFHDLANLMLAFVMLWAYFSFSQYLIIWSGNLPEEITWYLHRLQTGWRVGGDRARDLPLRGAVHPAALAGDQARAAAPV